MEIEVVVFDGFDELDVFGPFEVLALAGFSVRLVVADRPGPIVSMRGVKIEVTDVLGQPTGIVVPGGGWLNRAPRGSWAEAQRGVVPAALAEAAATARWVASVCTGAMLLATAGLLAGRHATTNRNAYDDLRPHVAKVVDERVVDDRDRITAGALSAGLDLGLWLAERELGWETADRVARTIEYTRHGAVSVIPE